jgi:predicted nuclease of predicted toxin-antitoxin system
VTNIFIELYLDEDVSVLVADLVRARGFTAITTREAGRLHASDADQLAYAISQRKTFLTHNRADFEALAQTYFATSQTHYGIVIAVRRPPYEIVRRLSLILNQVTADEIQNQLRYI